MGQKGRNPRGARAHPSGHVGLAPGPAPSSPRGRGSGTHTSPAQTGTRSGTGGPCTPVRDTRSEKDPGQGTVALWGSPEDLTAGELLQI